MSLISIALANLVFAAVIVAGLAAIMAGPHRRRTAEVVVAPARQQLDRAA